MNVSERRHRPWENRNHTTLKGVQLPIDKGTTCRLVPESNRLTAPSKGCCNGISLTSLLLPLCTIQILVFRAWCWLALRGRLPPRLGLVRLLTRLLRRLAYSGLVWAVIALPA